MSIGTGPQPNLAERERKASVVMTIVFFIIGLSVILSYNWGPPTPEFRTVYPYLTTVSDNRFRFRGGDPNTMRENLERLFRNRLGSSALKAHVER